MASKDIRVKAKNKAPTTVKTERVPLCDISVAKDSGWRALNNRHVTALASKFRKGEYGHNILGVPRIRLGCATKEPLVSSMDGKYMLNNGKCCIQALLQLAGRLALYV